MANTPVIEKFLQAIETAAIPGCDAWSADATLDATVPGWRLHAAGADAIRAEYARWFADPGHFDELHCYAVQELAPAGVRVTCVSPGSSMFPGGGWDTFRQRDPEDYPSARRFD